MVKQERAVWASEGSIRLVAGTGKDPTMENVITNDALQKQIVQDQISQERQESAAAAPEAEAPKAEQNVAKTEASAEAKKQEVDKEAIMALAKERLLTRRGLISKGLEILLLGAVLLIIASVDTIAGRMIIGLCYGVFVLTRYIIEVQRFRNAYRKPNAKKLEEEYQRLVKALEE